MKNEKKSSGDTGGEGERSKGVAIALRVAISARDDESSNNSNLPCPNTTVSYAIIIELHWSKSEEIVGVAKAYMGFVEPNLAAEDYLSVCHYVTRCRAFMGSRFIPRFDLALKGLIYILLI